LFFFDWTFTFFCVKYCEWYNTFCYSLKTLRFVHLFFIVPFHGGERTRRLSSPIHVCHSTTITVLNWFILTVHILYLLYISIKRVWNTKWNLNAEIYDCESYICGHDEKIFTQCPWYYHDILCTSGACVFRPQSGGGRGRKSCTQYIMGALWRTIFFLFDLNSARSLEIKSIFNRRSYTIAHNVKSTGTYSYFFYSIWSHNWCLPAV